MNKEKFTESIPVLATAALTINTDTTTYGEWIDTQFFNSLTVPLDIDITTDGEIASIGFQGSDVVGHADAADLDDALNLYYPDAFPVDADAVVHVGCVAKTRWVRLKIVSTDHSSGSIAIPKTLALLQDSIRKPLTVASSVIANTDIHSQGDLADMSSTYPPRPIV